MYSGARNEKRTETFVMFKKLIRPLINCIYKFACKKHSNVEEKKINNHNLLKEMMISAWNVGEVSVDSRFFFG